MPAWIFQGNKEHFQASLSVLAGPERFSAAPRSCAWDVPSSQRGCPEATGSAALGPSRFLTRNAAHRLFVLQKSPQRNKGLSKASAPRFPSISRGWKRAAQPPLE